MFSYEFFPWVINIIGVHGLHIRVIHTHVISCFSWTQTVNQLIGSRRYIRVVLTGCPYIRVLLLRSESRGSVLESLRVLAHIISVLI